MQHYDYKRDESNCACMPISILIIAKPRMRVLFVLNDHLHAVTSLIRIICRSKIISIVVDGDPCIKVTMRNFYNK